MTEVTDRVAIDNNDATGAQNVTGDNENAARTLNFSPVSIYFCLSLWYVTGPW